MKKRLIQLTLCSLLLNSCVSTLHKYFFAMGREGECVQIAEECQLYRAEDGTVYAKGYRTTFGHWPDDYMADLFRCPRYVKHIVPVEDAPPVWGEVRKTDKGWQRTDSPWFSGIQAHTPIPGSRLSKTGLTPMQAPHIAGDKTVNAEVTTPLHPTAHALYAYPLGVATAFAVDTPATAIGSTAAVLFAAVAAPCFQISDQIKHRGKEESHD